MHLPILLLLAAAQAPVAIPTDTSLLSVSSQPRFVTYEPSFSARATSRPDTVREHAVEHGNGYYTRLSIHRYASYATLPLFVTEYFLGQSLFNNPDQEGATRSAHSIVAGGIGVLFAVNTVTGVWNLWEDRHESAGRTRRYLHSISMLVADAGFAWAGATAPGDEGAGSAELDSRRRKHRTIAITSMGISLASYGMMLLWKD